MQTISNTVVSKTSISKTGISKTSVSQTSVSKTSISDMSGGSNDLGSRGIVDQMRSREGLRHRGVSINDGGFALLNTLGSGVSSEVLGGGSSYFRGNFGSSGGH